jgi:hypothetical protein
MAEIFSPWEFKLVLSNMYIRSAIALNNMGVEPIHFKKIIDDLFTPKDQS